MSYETRYAAIRNDLKRLMTRVADIFGAEVESYVGDDYGFEFAVDAQDGEMIHVTGLLEDGADHGAEGAGNVVIRVNRGDDDVLLVAPGNRTGKAFAEWEDDDAWQEKIEILEASIDNVASHVARAVGANSPKL